MKLSMWILFSELQAYRPTADIRDDAARITGVRMALGALPEVLEPQYVYLTGDQGRAPVSIALVNGEDRITLSGIEDQSAFLNDLLGIFDDYDRWEDELRGLAEHRDVQGIVDLGHAKLKNPMVVGDTNGNVLAMSSAYLDEDINDYWREARRTGHTPIFIATAPKYTEDGALFRFSDTPRIYNIPSDVRAIGAYIFDRGDRVATFGLLEYRHPLLPGHTHLCGTLCTALSQALAGRLRSAVTVTVSAIVVDLLEYKPVDESLLTLLEEKCPAPWRLMTVENPYYKEGYETGQHLLLRALKHVDPTCQTVIFKNHVVALITEGKVGETLRAVTGTGDVRNNVCGLSLPFDDPKDMPVRYAETLYMLLKADGAPGIYMGEDYALPYMMEQLIKINEKAHLQHPALRQLKDYDAQKNTELYDTLYQYLKCERSVQRCAQLMHVHKNTLLYRLDRVKEVISADLDDPVQRMYLLLSYIMELL